MTQLQDDDRGSRPYWSPNKVNMCHFRDLYALVEK